MQPSMPVITGNGLDPDWQTLPAAATHVLRQGFLPGTEFSNPGGAHLTVVEHRISWTAGFGAVALAIAGMKIGAYLSQAKHLCGEFMPRALTSAAHVIQAIVLRFNQRQHAGRQVCRRGGSNNLISYHANGFLLCCQPQHGLHKIAALAAAAAHAIKAAGADHEMTRAVATGGEFACQLRDGINRKRLRQVALLVRRAFLPAKNIIGAEVYEGSASFLGALCQVANPGYIHGKSFLRLIFTFIHSMKGGRVDYALRPRARDLLPHRFR